MTEQPTTAAGRALRMDWISEGRWSRDPQWLTARILAIEAEARQQDAHGSEWEDDPADADAVAITEEGDQQDGSALRSRIVQARSTLAALSLPLGATREVAQHERSTAIALIDSVLAPLPPSAPPATPFQRVVDDLTEGCGCGCHTGIGYNAACRHCRPHYPSAPPALDVERLEAVVDAYVRHRYRVDPGMKVEIAWRTVGQGGPLVLPEIAAEYARLEPER